MSHFESQHTLYYNLHLIYSFKQQVYNALRPSQSQQYFHPPVTSSTPFSDSIMPVRTSYISTSTYQSAQALPSLVWEALRANARKSNVILPHAEKALASEMSGDSPSGSERWIICSTFDPSSSETIDFILSCTESGMGSYPIFIVPTLPTAQLDEDYLLPRLSALVQALYNAVSVSRVYSVFAPEPVTEMFTDLWVELTGIRFIQEPYYAATFSFCTKRTHVDRSATLHPSLKYDMRPAVESDIENVAELCYGFAEGSVSTQCHSV